jgi:hypothetical protein
MKLIEVVVDQNKKKKKTQGGAKDQKRRSWMLPRRPKRKLSWQTKEARKLRRGKQ